MSIKRLNQKGIGLLETLLALGIGLIIITSLVSLAIFTLRSSLQNKLLLSGTQIANQEIELVRAYRDSNVWADFISDLDGTTGPDCFSTPCHMSSGVLTPLAGNGVLNSGTLEEITYGFQLTDVNGDQSLIRVSVDVSWQLGAETKHAYNYTELSDWRN